MNELKPIFYICPVMVFQTVKDESPSINSLREIQNREVSFLGGLSLHLNHLIQSRMEISYRQFGTFHWTSFVKFGLNTAYDIS